MRVDELTQPLIVGRYYLVPTVRYCWHDKIDDWPVIGPRHEDAEIIGFADWHYHVDGRFITAAQRRLAGGQKGDWEYAMAAWPLCRRYEPHPQPVWRPRRCSASVVAYPSASAKKFLPTLRAAYADRVLSRDSRGVWICPHRGAPLGSIAPNEYGVITCPLHGLQWCAATGLSARDTLLPRSDD